MTSTEQHNWPTPAEDDRDYVATFHEFFDQLDTAVEIRDTDSNKTQYEPQDGGKYVATDTGKLYLGDGNSWNHVSTLRLEEDIHDITGQMAGTALSHDDSGDTLNVVQEQIEDWVGSLVVGGTNVTVSYDDNGDSVTVDTSALDAEEVRDEVGTLLSGGNGITVSVDDENDTVTVALPSNSVTDDEIDESITPTWTGEHTFAGGITGLPEPTSLNDAATKKYTDAIKQGLDIKDPVRTSPTVNIDLTSTTDPNPVDDLTLSDGDRVLLQNQTTGSENGIYVASTATDPSTWSRAPDADEDSKVSTGLFTFVEEGGTYANTSHVITTDDPITVGSTALSFAKFSGAGTLNAGDGLTQSGDTFDISVSDFAGIGLVNDGGNDLDVDEFSINHDNLSGGTDSNAHHSRYSDSEAQTAVDGANIDIGGDADSVDGYDIQKNGSDGTGIINFKT